MYAVASAPNAFDGHVALSAHAGSGSGAGAGAAHGAFAPQFAMQQQQQLQAQYQQQYLQLQLQQQQQQQQQQPQQQYLQPMSPQQPVVIQGQAAALVAGMAALQIQPQQHMQQMQPQQMQQFRPQSAYQQQPSYQQQPPMQPQYQQAMPAAGSGYQPFHEHQSSAPPQQYGSYVPRGGYGNSYGGMYGGGGRGGGGGSGYQSHHQQQWQPRGGFQGHGGGGSYQGYGGVTRGHEDSNPFENAEVAKGTEQGINLYASLVVGFVVLCVSVVFVRIFFRAICHFLRLSAGVLAATARPPTPAPPTPAFPTLRSDSYDNIPVDVSGNNIPAPFDDFAALALPDALAANIALCAYSKPTPVQKHALPIGMANRDLMACAQTGSGKTAAFLLPIVAQARVLRRVGWWFRETRG